MRAACVYAARLAMRSAVQGPSLRFGRFGTGETSADVLRHLSLHILVVAGLVVPVLFS